jgi:hypothetical protein
VLAWRFPPRFRRCRTVLPEEAGIGEAPHRIEHAAWLRSRMGGIAGGDPQRPSDLRPDPAPLPELGRRLGGQPVKLGVHPGKLTVQGLVALAQEAQGQLGRCGRGRDRPWPHARCRAGQGAGGQAP